MRQSVIFYLFHFSYLLAEEEKIDVLEGIQFVTKFVDMFTNQPFMQFSSKKNI